MALTVKTMLVFLEYIYRFFLSKALPASNSVNQQNFMGKSVKNDLTAVCIISCHGAIGNQLTFHVRGLGSNSCHLKLFFFFFWSFCFVFL